MKIKNTTPLGSDECVKLAAMVRKDGAASVAYRLHASRHAIERAAGGKKIHAETARLLTLQLV